MPEQVPYNLPQYPDDDLLARGRAFCDLMAGRRSVRDFSLEPVPREAIELAIRAAASAPSGANRQPWHFVVIDAAETRRRVREGAEVVERAFYEGERRNAEWLDALEPLGTGWQKPFLETAPWLVVVFAERYGIGLDGKRRLNYYVTESVGIACGLFVAALHGMGLATLPYTPAPMGFLSEILGRPPNERPFIVFPVGHPAPDATVPDQARKPLDDVVTWRPDGGP